MATAVYVALVGLRLIGLMPWMALVGLGLGGGLWGWRIHRAQTHLMPSIALQSGWLAGMLATFPAFLIARLLTNFPMLSTTASMASFMGVFAFIQSVGWEYPTTTRRNWLILHLVGGALFGMIAPLGQGMNLLVTYALAVILHAICVGLVLLYLSE